MSRSSITLSQLSREYDLWNAEVSACTKAACGLAVRRLHAFFRWSYEREHGGPPPADFDVAVESISPRDIAHWRTWLLQGARDGRGGWLRKPVRPHTVHSYHAALRQVFRYGLELQPPLIESNPLAGVKNRRPPQPEPDVWSRVEIAALLRAIRRIRWQDSTAAVRWTSILYGLLHGQRINEVTTQRRIDLRPESGTVFVRARDDMPGQWWQWRTKGKVDRAVGVSPQYVRVLRRLLRACPWMFPHLSRRACQNRIARIGDLTWRQRQQPYSTVNRDFGVIVAQANVLRLEKGQPTIDIAYPHMGRQTAATALAARGVHPKVLSTIMGWSSAETGNRHYIQVRQEQAVQTSRSCFTTTGRRQLGNKDSNLD
jgi:integrase